MFCCERPGDNDLPDYGATPNKDQVRMAHNLSDNNSKKYYYTISLNFTRNQK